MHQKEAIQCILGTASTLVAENSNLCAVQLPSGFDKYARYMYQIKQKNST